RSAGAFAVATEALVGPAERVWRDDDVVQRQDRIVGWCRLDLEDVQAGSGDPTRPQRRIQRHLVDDRAAGSVDEESCRLHEREAVGVDQMSRLFGQWA